MEEDQVKCPKCGSTQISADKKGFSGKKAVAGAMVTGGIGLLAGTIGSNKIKITCLKCGHEFSPGDQPIVAREKGKYDDIMWGIVIACAFGIIILIALMSARK